MDSSERPFDGLKVIDCASFIAGPAAATILSDFGADVIKIEPPEGDAYRELYRFPGLPVSATNYPWNLDSRDKRSVALDLKLAEGLAVLQRLIAKADVFVTNFPLPVRRRLKIDYESIAPLNRRLIYASFTAYGEHGPEADKTGFDATAWWARSGLMDLVRADANATPARSVAGMGDHPSASALFGAIATALYRRERTGRGGMVSSSLMANGLWANGFFAQGQLSGARLIPRPPRTEAPNPITNIYRCRDGRWLSLVVLNEARQFEPLMRALDCEPQAGDPRFASASARAIHHRELIAIFDAKFGERDLAEWRIRLDAAGITFGLIGTLADIEDDEQMRAGGAVVPFADGSGLTISSPLDLDGAAKRAPGPAPALGQHSDEVLLEAGYSAVEIRSLRERKVLFG